MAARYLRALVAFFMALTMAAPLNAATDGAALFRDLSKDHRQLVLGQLQQLLGSSLENAKEQIRRNGELKPFAYVGDFQAKGRYVRLEEQEQVAPEVALFAVQRAVVKAAVDGTLAASLLYATTMGTEQLTAELEQRFTAELSGSGIQLNDVRFLLVEMQHVAGLGILQVIPYWRSDSGWEIGGALQQTIEPRLHQLVKSYDSEERDPA
jgi:hypothetical protein